MRGGPAGEPAQPTAGSDWLQPRPHGSVGSGSQASRPTLFGNTGNQLLCRLCTMLQNKRRGQLWLAEGKIPEIRFWDLDCI